MTITATPAGIDPTRERLIFSMSKPPEADGLELAVASFVARLEDLSDHWLVGLSGFYVDTGKIGRDGPFCVTIHDAEVRHTGPKLVGLATGFAAKADLKAGTDGRVACDTRYLIFLHLPEIYDESLRGNGTRLLLGLRRLLDLGDTTVFLDFGVEDEQDGFVAIFFPELRRRLGLTLSRSGQFARGVWSNGPPTRVARRDVGIVYL